LILEFLVDRLVSVLAVTFFETEIDFLEIPALDEHEDGGIKSSITSE
jgi:hypothetical protein